MTVAPIAGNATPSHSYMLPSVPKFTYFGTGENVRDLTDEDLYDEVMKCGVPLLDILEALARGYQLGNPVATLIKAVGVAACDAPKASVPTGIGSRPAPLNFLLCFVGPSGLGKGLSLDAPLVCASPLSGYRPITPASGEALISTFFDTVPAADGKGTETVQHDEPVWASWGEIDAFAAKSSTTASTLDAILRSLWTGEGAGDVSISRKKQGVGCRVEAGTYRFVMSVGAQIDRAGVFLDDTAGGTLQRLFWVPLVDDDAPVNPADIRAYRHRLRALLGLPPQSKPRQSPNIAVWGPHGAVDISDAIEDLMLESRGSVLRREVVVSSLETHDNNTRVRLAAVFAAWRAGTVGSGEFKTIVVDEQDWWWASCLLEISRRARNECISAAKVKKSKVAKDSGVTDAERFNAREDELDRLHRAAADQVKPKILEAVEGVIGRATWCGEPRKNPSKAATTSEIKRYLSKRFRVHFDSAIQDLIDNEEVIRVADGTVVRYVMHPNAANAYTGS